jgi:hypothetical protein
MLVYTGVVRNITFSADETLIEKARAVAASHNRTLNEEFREWLEKYVSNSNPGNRFLEFIEQTKHIRLDRKFTRDEMNER